MANSPEADSPHYNSAHRTVPTGIPATFALTVEEAGNAWRKVTAHRVRAAIGKRAIPAIWAIRTIPEDPEFI